jgi:hypothetical protein
MTRSGMGAWAWRPAEASSQQAFAAKRRQRRHLVIVPEHCWSGRAVASLDAALQSKKKLQLTFASQGERSIGGRRGCNYRECGYRSHTYCCCLVKGVFFNIQGCRWWDEALKNRPHPVQSRLDFSSCNGRALTATSQFNHRVSAPTALPTPFSSQQDTERDSEQHRQCHSPRQPSNDGDDETGRN